MDLAQRINLGTKFLDDVHPGWAGQIDLNELDLENPHACVLGQLYREEAETAYANAPFSGYSGYTIGGFRLHDWLVKNGYFEDDEIGSAQELAGFERLGVYEETTSNDRYSDLQAAWTEVIQSRVQ